MNVSPVSLFRVLGVSVILAAPLLSAPSCNMNDVSIGQNNQQIVCQTDSDCPANVPCQNGICSLPGTDGGLGGAGGSPVLTSVGVGGGPAQTDAGLGGAGGGV